MPRYTRPPIERFMEKVSKQADGCWIWTASLNRGYGQFRYDGKPRKAYRWSYEHFIGPIPEGMQVDHICRVPACVNPEHLRVCTNKQNMENLGDRAGNPYRGACWNKRFQRWEARVSHNGKSLWFGAFGAREEAAAAAKAARLQLFSHNELDRE